MVRKQTTHMTFALDDVTDKRLKEIAIEDDRSVSQTVRYAVKQFLRRRSEDGTTSKN